MAKSSSAVSWTYFWRASTRFKWGAADLTVKMKFRAAFAEGARQGRRGQPLGVEPTRAAAPESPDLASNPRHSPPRSCQVPREDVVDLAHPSQRPTLFRRARQVCGCEAAHQAALRNRRPRFRTAQH